MALVAATYSIGFDTAASFIDDPSIESIVNVNASRHMAAKTLRLLPAVGVIDFGEREFGLVGDQIILILWILITGKEESDKDQ